MLHKMVFGGVFRPAAALCFADVMADMGPRIEPHDVGDMFRDFEQAKSHMSTMMTLKMHHGQSLR